MTNSTLPRFRDFCPDSPKYRPRILADLTLLVGTIAAVLVGQFGPASLPGSAVLAMWAAFVFVFWQLYNWEFRVRRRERAHMERYRGALCEIPVDRLVAAIRKDRVFAQRLSMAELQAADSVLSQRLNENECLQTTTDTEMS